MLIIGTLLVLGSENKKKSIIITSNFTNKSHIFKNSRGSFICVFLFVLFCMYVLLINSNYASNVEIIY